MFSSAMLHAFIFRIQVFQIPYVWRSSRVFMCFWCIFKLITCVYLSWADYMCVYVEFAITFICLHVFLLESVFSVLCELVLFRDLTFHFFQLSIHDLFFSIRVFILMCFNLLLISLAFMRLNVYHGFNFFHVFWRIFMCANVSLVVVFVFVSSYNFWRINTFFNKTQRFLLNNPTRKHMKINKKQPLLIFKSKFLTK